MLAVTWLVSCCRLWENVPEGRLKLVGRVVRLVPFEVAMSVVFSRRGGWAELVPTLEAADTSLKMIGEVLDVFVEAAGWDNNLAWLGALHCQGWLTATLGTLHSLAWGEIMKGPSQVKFVSSIKHLGNICEKPANSTCEGWKWRQRVAPGCKWQKVEFANDPDVDGVGGWYDYF